MNAMCICLFLLSEGGQGENVPTVFLKVADQTVRVGHREQDNTKVCDTTYYLYERDEAVIKSAWP